MIAIGANGLVGDVSTPMTMPMRLFQQGIVMHRGITGSFIQAITFVENGDIQFSAEAIGNPKASTIMGSCTTPIAYCYTLGKGGSYEFVPDDQPKAKSVKQRVDTVLKKVEELYFENFRTANGYEANGEMAKMVDVMIETVPRVGRNEFLIYIDRNEAVIETDLIFKARMDDALQDEYTTQLRGIRAIPDPKVIGYGLMRDGWSKITRPNTYMRIAPRTVLKMGKIANDFLKVEWQVQSFYIYVLATAFKEWLGSSIPAYDLNDWVAYCNLLVGAFAGYGNTEREQKWMATDIETQLNMMPGFAWTKANRFMWEPTAKDLKKYYCLMNLLGFTIQRVKGAMMDFQFKTVVSTNDYQVPVRFKRAMQPNIEGWGSIGTFFFLMPRNNFAYGDKSDTPFPCIIDDRPIDDQNDIIKHANNYEDLLPYKQQTWKDINIDRGEVTPGALSATSMETMFGRLHATNDSRIVSYQDANTEYIRNLIQYRFPFEHIVRNGISREKRMQLWLAGIFTNGEKGMKNAYVIESSLGIFGAQEVNYRRGPLDSQLVDKKDTNTVGDQFLKPGTIPTTVGASGTTTYTQDIKPPAPTIKQVFSEKTIELKSGEEVAEVKAADAGNKNAADTNNQPETT